MQAQSPAVAHLAQLQKRAEEELVHNLLPFWLKHAYTPDGRPVGIITTRLRHEESAPRSIVISTRLGWTFAAAYRWKPEPLWLEMARRANQEVVQHFWDDTHGGLYWWLDGQRRPLSDRKQTYAQAFGIYSLCELHAATGEAQWLERAVALYQLIEKHAADPVQGGYIEALDRRWGPLEDMRLSEKDLNSAKSMNTHIHILEAYSALLRRWPDAGLRARQTELLGVLLDKIYRHAPQPHLALFFDRDWHSYNRNVSFGHDIETSWLMCEAAELLDNPALLARTHQAASDLAEAVLVHGRDPDGAVLYEGVDGRIVVGEKVWWPQAEAVVGFLNSYAINRDPRHLEAALSVWNFIEARLIDREHGEWFRELNRDLSPQAEYPAHKEGYKIGPWKCAYHNSRACLEILRRVPALGH